MNVYERTLLKIYEITGGKDTEDVDLADLLKREGFYQSLPGILEQLSSQSWITETKRRNVVRLTHWGKAEALKMNAAAPQTKKDATKDASRILNQARELVRIAEEFVADSSKENLSRAEIKLDELKKTAADIKENLN